MGNAPDGRLAALIVAACNSVLSGQLSPADCRCLRRLGLACGRLLSVTQDILNSYATIPAGALHSRGVQFVIREQTANRGAKGIAPG